MYARSPEESSGLDEETICRVCLQGPRLDSLGQSCANVLTDSSFLHTSLKSINKSLTEGVLSEKANKQNQNSY